MIDGDELVGRTHELEVLRAALAEARDGRGGTVSLSGEPGVGKTAMARAFVAAADVRVLWGTCSEGAAQPAYGPWLAALATLGLDLPIVAGLPAPEARARLFATVLESLQEASAAAFLVVVIDDLQWASAESLELFGHVATRAEDAGLLVIGTYRDPDVALALEGHAALAPLLSTLARLPRHTRLHLGGLGSDDVATYLSRAMGDEVPGAVVEAVREHTQGNPFYVREVVRVLVDEGRLVHRDGRWLTDFSLDELAIPATVRHAVRGRLAGLDDTTRVLLQAAAAFAEDFDLETVREVAGLEESAGLDAVDEALASGFLHPTGRAEAPYAFAHAIVRHTLAESLNPDRAARLHRRAAEVLARVRSGGRAAIAEQYWLSRSLPGAEVGVTHCLAAADAATEEHAPKQTARLLRFALDLIPGDDEAGRVEVLVRLALAEAEGLDVAAATTATSVVDRVVPADAADLLVRVVEALRQGTPATTWAPLARRGLELVGDDRGARWARLVTLLDPVEPVRGRSLEVGRWRGYPHAAVAALEATGREDDAARAIDPFRPRTVAETEDLLRRSAGWSSPQARMRALDLAGRDLSLRHGRVGAGVDSYSRLLDIGEQVGSLPARAEAHGQLALCLALSGDLPGAEHHLALAASLVRDLWPGHRLHLLGTVSSSAVVAYLLGEGEWAGMGERLGAWIRTPAAAGAPFANVFVALGALCHAFAGNRSEAELLLDELAAVLEAMSPFDHAVAGSLWFATAAAWQLSGAPAVPALSALVDRHRAAGGPSGPATVEHAAGRLAALTGNRESAVRELAVARQAADQAGSLGVVALSDFDAAVLEESPEGVERARRTFERLGMRGWAGRAVSWAPSRAPERPCGLTHREVEVLRLLAAGHTSAEIATSLVVSPATVNRHIANIYTKIDVRNRAEATSFAIGHGLLPGTGLHTSV